MATVKCTNRGECPELDFARAQDDLQILDILK